MLIPIGTDAPIYFRPFVTIGLIVANIWAFIVTDGGGMSEGWLLTFGNGLHPTEWVKSAFLHFGIGHLVGNMIFLMIFGLIIEGKLGPLKFLLLYLTLCFLDGFVGQFLMLNYTGLTEGAGGASGVIFALMAMAWLWAPKNCIEVLYIFHMHARGTFEVSLEFVAVFYIGTNLLSAWIWGFAISTPVLHLLGAGVGFGVGWLLLKRDWVDCEGWDLLSLQRADHPTRTQTVLSNHYNQPTRTISKTDEPKPRTRLKQIEQLLAQGEFDTAWQMYAALKTSPSPRPLPQDRLDQLLKGLIRTGHWVAAVDVLEEWLRRFDEDSVKKRLALASILTRQLQRPRAALNTLRPLSNLTLSLREKQRFRQIHQEAQQQIETGVLEIQVPAS